MIRRLRGAVLAAVTIWVGGAPPGVSAADAAQGRALYETRCVGCHDRSVHARKVRSARSFDELRGYVVSWDRQTGGLWRDDEIEAVTRYLNERYYRYPCPAAACGSERG